MSSEKSLNGIANNIMDHAVSGLSFIHSHLGKGSRSTGILEITLDLMKESPLPEKFPAEKPLVLSTQALHQKFLEILNKNEYSISDVLSMILVFEFWNKTEHFQKCRVRVVNK